MAKIDTIDALGDALTTIVDDHHNCQIKNIKKVS